MLISELSSFGWSVVVRRRRSQFGIKACSLLVSTDDTMKKAAKVISLPSSIRAPQKTVGIIGGKSVFSTLVFVEKIVWWSSKHGEETIPFVLCSDTELNKELSVYDPLAMNNSMAQFDSDQIVENLRGKKELLEQAGAGCVVIPCYLLHVWHDEVAKMSRVPILHAGECAALELKRAKMKPIEAGNSMARVGVLGTNLILQAGVYQQKLEKQGFEAVLPDRATMEHIVIPAMEAMEKKDIEGAQNLLRIAIQVLLVGAVNMVILASEEMQGLLPRDDPLLKKCIDPMDALARSTVEWSRSHGKQTNCLRT